MSVERGSEPGVWQRLRRRRVTRTAVTYVSAAFATVELTWYLVPRYGLVDDVSRLVAGLLVLGFPLTIVLAWTYDVTPQGIVRTPDDTAGDAPDANRPRLRRSLWLLLCVGLLAVGFVVRAMR